MESQSSDMVTGMEERCMYSRCGEDGKDMKGRHSVMIKDEIIPNHYHRFISTGYRSSLEALFVNFDLNLPEVDG